MTDMEDFIMEVEKHPCLWNVGDESYHNKNLRDVAWEEICQKVVKNWNDLNDADKITIRKEKKKEWNNIRDGFKKYLNRIRNTPTGSGVLSKKKYLYADSLQFLIPVVQTTRPREGNVPPESPNNADMDDAVDEQESQSDDENEERKRRKALRRDDSKGFQKKKKKKEDVPQQILNIIKEKSNSDSNYQDEDSQFLLSFRNDLKGMSRSQKLQFKMGMIQLIQNITENKQNIFPSPYHTTSSRSSYTSTPSPSPNFPIVTLSGISYGSTLSHTQNLPNTTFSDDANLQQNYTQDCIITYASTSNTTPNVIINSIESIPPITQSQNDAVESYPLSEFIVLPHK